MIKARLPMKLGYFTKINESLKEFWEILRNFGAQSKEYQNLVVRALFKRRFFRKSRIFHQMRSKLSDQAFVKNMLCRHLGSKFFVKFAKRNETFLDCCKLRKRNIANKTKNILVSVMSYYMLVFFNYYLVICICIRTQE